ncbi:MAG: hypothetical protein HQM08_24585 [Candidatus Riflebacteria bacterium]|nr:hypothetical protein [Candidatus Riflebacteria bacterium]
MAVNGINVNSSSWDKTVQPGRDEKTELKSDVTGAVSQKDAFPKVDDQAFLSNSGSKNTPSSDLLSGSRIQDIDTAQATAELTRQQIVQQPPMAVKAQANVSPQAAFDLLS